MKKSVLLLFLSFVLLLSSSALADNTRTSGLYTYEIKGNGTLTITKFNWAANNGDVFIPNMIDGYTVTAIGDKSFYCEKKSSNWVTVTLPESIKSIGNEAFGNSGIKAINIPDSIQLIGEGAFYGCKSCQFKVSPNQAYFATIEGQLYNKTKKELIAYSSYGTDGTYREKLIIPEGILSIGSYAFAGLEREDNVLYVQLPTTLQTVKDYAFYNAGETAVHFMNLGNTHITTIGNYAFSGVYHTRCLDTNVVNWSNAKEVSAFSNDSDAADEPIFLPSTLETLGNGAFYDFKTSTDAVLIIPENANITEIPNYAFYTTAYESLRIPIEVHAPVSSVGENSGIRNGLKHPECVTKLAANPDCGASFTSPASFSPNLTRLPTGLKPRVKELPNSVTTIESDAMQYCTDFVLSPYLVDIAIDAFPSGSTFIVESGSYAELWCEENGFGYSIKGQTEDLSWLN